MKVDGASCTILIWKFCRCETQTWTDLDPFCLRRKGVHTEGRPSSIVDIELLDICCPRASLSAGVFLFSCELTGSFIQSSKDLRLPNPVSGCVDLGIHVGSVPSISNICLFAVSLSLLQASHSAACKSRKGDQLVVYQLIWT